jgi:hypothetical protein
MRRNAISAEAGGAWTIEWSRASVDGMQVRAVKGGI